MTNLKAASLSHCHSDSSLVVSHVQQFHLKHLGKQSWPTGLAYSARLPQAWKDKPVEGCSEMHASQCLGPSVSQIFAALLATRRGQRFHEILSRWGNLIATVSTFFKATEIVDVDLTLQALVVADVELDQIRDLPSYRGLFGAVDRLLTQEAELISDKELPQCVEAVEAIGHERRLQLFHRLRDQKCFECPICRSWVGKSLQLQCSMPSRPSLFHLGHRFCCDCLRTWALLPEQLQSMILRRSFTLPCFCCVGSGRCPGTILAQDLAGCGRCECTVRPCSCSRLAKLGRDLEFRDRILQSSGLFRRILGNVLECPQEGCVGLAYTDTGVAMCFMCEHQWEPETSFLRLVGRFWNRRSEDLPFGCKRCPSCQVLIAKDGGCDHMTCRCGYEFYWSNLSRYRN